MVRLNSSVFVDGLWTGEYAGTTVGAQTLVIELSAGRSVSTPTNRVR